MKILKTVLSNTEPSIKDALWLKPVDGGFQFFVLDGTWKAMKEADPQALNAVEDAEASIVGTSDDTSSDMTLYGLKAYIDAQIEGLDG